VHRLDLCGVFRFLSDLRTHLSNLATDLHASRKETLQLSGPREVAWPQEPRLVVVEGLRPGQAFPLSGDPPSPDRGWIIGRSPDAEIPLTYDPYISPEQVEITPTGEGNRLLDLRASKNRTMLNDTELPRGAEVDLVRGDLVGVGRSSLVYHGP
jgi:hypothetical protein